MRTLLFSLFAALLIGAAACGTENKDGQLTVIKNVTGYTFHDDSLETFSAIVFEDGKIVEVAFDDSLQTDTSDARMIEGAGRVMLPGLTDAHAHVMGLGYQEINVNVAGIPTLDETLQHVKKYADKNPDLAWIRGRGWNQTHWPINRFPTAEELDEVISDRPVWLGRVDGHAGWANTKAMELAGITKETQSPEGGKIIRDENGNPTGVFID
ncbi:MAG: amidohydrolase family protein, partial [Balneolaceae bacterium]|nr:amidohydrolase family protein [Balneolaceae bacterium]